MEVQRAFQKLKTKGVPLLQSAMVSTHADAACALCGACQQTHMDTAAN